MPAFAERRAIIQAMNRRPSPLQTGRAGGPHGRVSSWSAILLLAAGSLAACAVPPPPPPPPVAGAAEILAAIRPDRIVDLSYAFDRRTIYWPTAQPFRLTSDFHGRTPGGFFYASNSLCASEHGGTHLDAPSHFAEAGLGADQIPPGSLIAPAAVLDVRAACAADPDRAATVEDVRAYEAEHGTIPEGAVAILFTGWGARWPDRKSYLGDDTPGDASRLHFPGFSAEAATFLAMERRVAGLGIDTASIDRGMSRDFQAHQAAAAANVYNLENLASVDRLPPKGATLIVLPMKIAGGTGAPARVIAILP